MVFKHPALNGRIIDDQEAEIKRLRSGLHIARGALQAIGTDYAIKVADDLAPLLEPSLVNN